MKSPQILSANCSIKTVSLMSPVDDKPHSSIEHPSNWEIFCLIFYRIQCMACVFVCHVVVCVIYCSFLAQVWIARFIYDDVSSHPFHPLRLFGHSILISYIFRLQSNPCPCPSFERNNVFFPHRNHVKVVNKWNTIFSIYQDVLRM